MTLDYKYIYIEQRGEKQLIKLKRDNRTVAGITAKGVVIIVMDVMDEMADDEILELLSVPSTHDPRNETYDEFRTRVDKKTHQVIENVKLLERGKLGETFDYFDIGQELALTESYWQANPKLDRSIKVDKVYINKFFGNNHETIEIAIEYGNTKFTHWVSRELAYEMRYIWNLEHK